jgi:hypothetical protein
MMMTGVVVALLVAGASTPSPAPDDYCELSKDRLLTVQSNTVVFMFNDCGDLPMTREALDKMVACSESQLALTKQRQRLRDGLWRRGFNVVRCFAGFRVRLAKGQPPITVGERITHVGVALLGPGRVPSESSELEEDAALLSRINAYFQ